MEIIPVPSQTDLCILMLPSCIGDQIIVIINYFIWMLFSLVSTLEITKNLGNYQLLAAVRPHYDSVAPVF